MNTKIESVAQRLHGAGAGRTGGMELQRVAALADFYSEAAKRKVYLTNSFEREAAFEHLADMASRLRKLLEEGRVEKAMRWLGFMQGAMWALGVYTIEELKNHSRPDFPIPTIETP